MNLSTYTNKDVEYAKLTYEKLRDAIESLTGVQTIESSCVMCGSIEFCHGEFHMDGHPFCNSTLEYLEWRYDVRQKKV